MKIVVAADKFKGSLTADDVALHVTAGVHRVDPAIEVVAVAVADGGEGTVAAALANGFTAETATVTGPTGQRVDAPWARRGDDAVIEMALASGLALLPGGIADPLGATSRGTGELVQAALEAGCSRIVMGIGGSASTDGGAGMLQGLGARLLGADGRAVPRGGGALAALARVDLEGLHPRLRGADLVLASDVDNTLLGDAGAAAVFGPQKGASLADIAVLDGALRHFVDILDRTHALPVPASQAARMPGSGAAGGVGFAALALGAHRWPGVDIVLELTDFAATLTGADLVITGEGSFDAQSLGGKTPIGVQRAAAARGIPVHVVCGRSELTAEDASAAGFASLYALSAREPDPQESMARAGALVEDAAEDLIRAVLSS